MGECALDLAAAGWGLAYVDAVVAHHHPAARGPRPGRNRTALRNALWVAWLRRRLPAAAAATARTGAACLRHGELTPLVAALGGLPWVLRERRPLPPAVERAAAKLS
jgi:hypothetical protein